MTLDKMIEDLCNLSNKGYGDKEVEIYCVNCDCNDNFNGATGSNNKIQITVNGK